MRRALVLGACVALAFAACTKDEVDSTPETPNEALADRVMRAIVAGDMHPVMNAFVPERAKDLVDRDKVSLVHRLALTGGGFLRMKEISRADTSNAGEHDFTAFFKRGQQGVEMTLDGRGYIIHYHLNGPVT